MASVLRPGTLVARYKLVELAGDGSQSNIYLAELEPEMHWLIQIENPEWEPNVPFANIDRFTAHGGQWVALPTVGTSMVNLASWVDRLELPFIGWRWANLGREVGLLHKKGVVLQNTQPLALDRLEFTRGGELSIVQGRGGASDEYTFPAPQSADAVNAAADVYALGASLQALAGDNLPRNVQGVIRRATDPDASKRYPDGSTFGEALAEVLSDPQREKVAPPRPKHSVLKLVAIASVVICLGLALCVGALYTYAWRMFQLGAPTITAIQPERLRVTILKWEMLQGCNARAEVTVQDEGQPVTRDDGLSFFVLAPQASVNQIEIAPGAEPAATALQFALGDFCVEGGALAIGARRDDREGTSTVYYYPPDEDIPEKVALYKAGGTQARIYKFSTSHMNFGLASRTGEPANLKGAIKIRLLQDGLPVHDARLKAVNGALDPLVVVLVMDTSKSMTGDALAKSQLAAAGLVAKLYPNDYVCVYRFATEVSEPHVCSTDKESASKAIAQLTAGGNTSLYDVLVEVGKRHANRADRQAIILLSDGADNNSKATREQALNDIAKTNVPVYAIGLVNQDLAPAVLAQIAERTGGDYMEAPTPDDLERLFDKLQARFDNQYEVEFQSLFPDRERGTLELFISDGEGEISIKKEYQVQP